MLLHLTPCCLDGHVILFLGLYMDKMTHSHADRRLYTRLSRHGGSNGLMALPQLVLYKWWRTEHRSPQTDDIVLVLYEKKVGKSEYRLWRILKVHPDSHGIVQTVTMGTRGKDKGTIVE